VSLRLAGSLISGAVIGKLLGFGREIEMARLLGANVIADSLRASLTAVLLPVAPMQSEMLPAVLIPMQKDWRETGSEAQRAAALAILLTAVSVVIAFFVYALAAPWIGVLVANFDPAEHGRTVQFTRIMSLSIPASVLAGCLSAFEIALGKSRIAVIRASTQNIGMLFGIWIAGYTHYYAAIPWSFVIAFNLVALYGTIRLWKRGAITVRGLTAAIVVSVGATFWRRFRTLLSIPLADQGNLVVERMLASGLGVGALASLDYARTLTESAFYLISQPLGYLVLRREANRDQTRRDEVLQITRPLLALGVPVTVFITVFAPDIVRVIFNRGAFDMQAVALTSGALRGIAVGLWASMLGWVLARLVNVAGRNGTVAAISLAAYAANIAVNVAGVPFLGTFGLGLGEASKGLVMLAGAALALRCSRVVCRCLAESAVVALALVVVGIGIAAAFENPLVRLLLASPFFATAVAGMLVVYVPEARHMLRDMVSRLSARASHIDLPTKEPT
jgi:putative peptidoglycan lipid II flippase